MTRRFYINNYAGLFGNSVSAAAFQSEFTALQAADDRIQDELDALNGSYLPKVSTASTDYTFPAATSRTRFEFTASSAVTARIVTGRFTDGIAVLIIQRGTGSVTVTAESGVTLYNVDGSNATGKQYATLMLVCLGSETFLLIPVRDSARLSGGNTFTGAQTVPFVALSDGASIATDASLGNHFSVTLGGNRTLANPTNMRDGGIYNWRVKQDGTGSRTLAYGSKFKWPSGTAPTLSTTAGYIDRITGQYHAADDVIECGITKDFR